MLAAAWGEVIRRPNISCQIFCCQETTVPRDGGPCTALHEEAGDFQLFDRKAVEALRLLGERGEEIVITRHGKEVARLVPSQTAFNRDQARAAIRRIRERAEKLKLGPFE